MSGICSRMKYLNPNTDGARRSQRIQRQQDVSDDPEESDDEGSSEGDSSEDEGGQGNDNGQEEDGSEAEAEDGEQNDEEEEEEEAGDDDGDGQDDAVSSEKNGEKAKGGGDSTSSTPSKGAKPSPSKTDTSKSSIVSGLNYTVDEMVQNTIMYLLLQHNKKTPIKRLDITKNAMNNQSKSFAEVMDKIKVIFEERFGIELVGVEPKARTGGYVSYILVSNFQMSATQSAINVTPEQEMKRAILLILLALAFMLNRPIDEEMTWRVLEGLQLTSVCKKKDDLKRFLKQEYVSTLFLKAEENKETDTIQYRYDWGLRAKKEFSRYWVLKFVTKLFPEKKPYDFTVQYNIVMGEEKEIVEADRAEMEANDLDDDDEEDATLQKNSAPGSPSVPEDPGMADIGEGNEDAAGMDLEGGEEEPAEYEDQEAQSGSESESGSGSGSGSGSDDATRGSERSDSRSSRSSSDSDSD
ncbi:unnamed protein product [Allacma fusca]|uniref:MAGE domain-containing protein n=1 Tax=Allacma fusca TaxID=39272 RepID=A0A8J2LIE8_9HEXA|nr:unnamed protein product [Allacma fusca]